MNIMSLVSEYPSIENTVPNIFVHNINKALQRSGINVSVCLMDFRSVRRFRPWGLSRYNYDGINVYRLSVPCGPFRSALNFLKHSTAKLLFDYCMKYEEKPDIIHAHFGGMGYTGKLIGDMFNLPYIITEHSSGVLLGNKEEMDYYKLGYRDAKMVVAVSNEMYLRLRRLGIDNSIVIPNILNKCFRYDNNIQKYDEFTIISVGHLHEYKRFDIVIKAVDRLKKIGIDVNLLIVGEGNKREE